jgi:hypothetical protein
MIPNVGNFQKQRDSARQSWATNQAQNTWQANQANMMAGRQMQDYTQSWKRQLPQFTASFGARGLAGQGISSGVMKNAMSQYTGDYVKNLGRMGVDQASQRTGYDFNASRFDDMKNQQINDINAAQAAEIAQTAQYISALAPYRGGY